MVKIVYTQIDENIIEIVFSLILLTILTISIIFSFNKKKGRRTEVKPNIILIISNTLTGIILIIVSLLMIFLYIDFDFHLINNTILCSLGFFTIAANYWLKNTHLNAWQYSLMLNLLFAIITYDYLLNRELTILLLLPAFYLGQVVYHLIVIKKEFY